MKFNLIDSNFIGTILFPQILFFHVFFGLNFRWCYFAFSGGIEITALSKYFQIEIDVVDIQTGRIDQFGELVFYFKFHFILKYQFVCLLIYLLKTFKFIKAVSDTVLDMINAVYHDKPLIFIRAIRLSLSRLFLTLY